MAPSPSVSASPSASPFASPSASPSVSASPRLLHGSQCVCSFDSLDDDCCAKILTFLRLRDLAASLLACRRFRFDAAPRMAEIRLGPVLADPPPAVHGLPVVAVGPRRARATADLASSFERLVRCAVTSAGGGTASLVSPRGDIGAIGAIDPWPGGNQQPSGSCLARRPLWTFAGVETLIIDIGSGGFGTADQRAARRPRHRRSARSSSAVFSDGSRSRFRTASISWMLLSSLFHWKTVERLSSPSRSSSRRIYISTFHQGPPIQLTNFEV